VNFEIMFEAKTGLSKISLLMTIKLKIPSPFKKLTS